MTKQEYRNFEKRIDSIEREAKQIVEDELFWDKLNKLKKSLAKP